MEAPRVIVPLAIETRLGVSVLRWLGEPLTQYGDALVSSSATQDDLAAAWQAINQLPADIILLRNIRQTANAVGLTKGRGQRLGETLSPYLDLDLFRCGADYSSVMGKGADKRARTAQRRLAALGEVSFRVDHGDAARASARAAIAMKAAWLEARGLTRSAIECPVKREALVDLSGSAGGAVSALMLDGVLVAAEIGFFHRDHYIAYLGAFHADYANRSPGRVQMLHTINWCREQGFKAYDLLPPGGDYKEDWSSHSEPVFDFAEARTALGTAFLAMQKLRPHAKAIYTALPPSLKRLAGRAY
jgi:CelD/BcsL family acetyltransferase involved in cellulose biosynthesis